MVAPAVTLLLACTPATDADDDAPRPGCPSDLPSDSGCPGTAPSYASAIQPLIDTHCGGCHYVGNKNSKQVLETYEDVHASVSLVEKEVYRCAMPPAGETPLSATERTSLLQWLVCGAPDN